MGQYQPPPVKSTFRKLKTRLSKTFKIHQHPHLYQPNFLLDDINYFKIYYCVTQLKLCTLDKLSSNILLSVSECFRDRCHLTKSQLFQYIKACTPFIQSRAIYLVQFYLYFCKNRKAAQKLHPEQNVQSIIIIGSSSAWNLICIGTIIFPTNLVSLIITLISEHCN